MLTFACALAAVLAVQEDPDRERFAARIGSFIEVLVERHISAPAEDELLEAGIEHMAEQLDRSLADWAAALPATDTIDLLRRLHDAAAPHGDATEIMNAMLAGISGQLPGNTRVIDAEQARVDDSLDGNRYVGVGVIVDFRDGRPVITGTYFGGPAHRAGILAGDVVYEVEGVDTAGMDVARFLGYSRDESGTEFTYLVGQPGSDVRRPIRLTRGVVPRETVVGTARGADERWTFGLESSPAAYVRLTGITSSTAHELRQAAERIRRDGHVGLVLDLRGCYTTMMQATALVADLFVTEGLLGSSATRTARREYRASPDAMFDPSHMVVVVDQRTVGTAVWLATLLKRAGARTAGETTSAGTLLMERVTIPGWPSEVRMATGRIHALDADDWMGALEPGFRLDPEGAEVIREACALVPR